jgi:N-acyl homoserine lactone hydrolase
MRSRPLDPLFALCLCLVLQACSVTSHPVLPATLGTPRPAADMLALLDTPGSVTLQTVNSADWSVDRSGLINLEHASAREAGLEDGLEPIAVYFHVLTHPTRGAYLIDTGVERALRDQPEKAALRGLAASALGTDRMTIRAPLGEWLAQRKLLLSGVLLTHLHGDHVLGLPDVPPGTPLYTGPGEAEQRGFLNALVQPTMNRLLDGHQALQELKFAKPTDARLATLDLFGDGSVWALHAPGHTPGNLAFLVRTPEGPVLLVGDSAHTAWGWEHDVEPGSFTADHAENARSLAQLRRLVREYPSIDVRLGHQPLHAPQVPEGSGEARPRSAQAESAAAIR